MDQVNHEDIQVSEYTHITRMTNCDNNTNRRAGGHEIVSLSSEYGKHLSTVVLNNYNLLFGLSPTPFQFPVLIYYYYQLCYLYSCISEISKICNSECKCTCKCQCVPGCKGNFICLCLCNSDKTELKDCCICICKHKDCPSKCICICKNGEQCCCVSGKAHTCEKCLVKVDVSKLGFQASDVIDDLFYIKCSLQSLRTNIRVTEINKINQVMSMYSVMNVMDYKVVVNRLLECAKKIDQILQIIPWPDCCLCILVLESTNKIELKTINVQKIIQEITKETKSDDLMLDQIKNLNNGDFKDNHLCLCMVLKYILYPKIINLVYLMSLDLESLSTISRKFSYYRLSKGSNFDLWSFCILSIRVIGMIVRMIKEKLVCSCIWPICKCVTKNKSRVGSSQGSKTVTDDIHYGLSELYKWFKFFVDISYNLSSSIHQGIIPNISKCYCKYNEDSYYPYLISIILFVSSLIENIWTMDPETIRMAIERLSLLYSQLEIYDLNSTSLKRVCCNPVYSLLVNKECKTKVNGKCCCCWCTSVVNVLMMCISLSIQCKLCKALCTKKEKNGCDKWKKFCEVDKCECQCQQKDNGMCCLLKIALSSEVPCGNEELKKALEKCCKECQGGNGCCAKLKEKLQEGLCKLLLLVCNSTCAEASKDGDVKGKIVTFKNPYSDKSVAVIVFCKCADTTKGCCLYQLINNFETKLGDNLCQDQKCVCEKLEDVCQQICGSECAECVCTTLKKNLQKYANQVGVNVYVKKWKNVLKNVLKEAVLARNPPRRDVVSVYSARLWPIP